MLHVNVATGEVCHSALDFSLPSFISLEFERNYRSQANRKGLLGWNWSHPFNLRLEIGATEFFFHNDFGACVSLPQVPAGSQRLLARSSDGAFELLRQGESPDQYVLNAPGNRKLHFQRTSQSQTDLPILRLEDVHGNANLFEHDRQGRIVLVTDTFGRRLEIDYSLNGHLAEFRLVTDRTLGKAICLARYEYDSNDDLVAVTDSCGHVCRFDYRDHLVVRAVNRNGGAQYAQYDSSGRCIQTWMDGGQRSRQFRYDDSLKKTSVLDALGSTTIFRWNDAQIVTSETDAWGGTRRTILDQDNTVVAALNEAGLATPIATFNAAERMRTIVDANGAMTIAHEDEAGRLASVTNAVGATTRWRYNEFGKVSAVTTDDGSERNYEYDSQGFLAAFSDAKGNQVRQHRTSDGRTFKVTDRVGLVSQYEYDLLGNMVAVVDGNDSRHLLLRDHAGRLLEHRWPDGSRIRYQYDPEGNLAAFIDELGNQWRYDRDAFGQCLKVTGPSGEHVRYEYDAEARLVTIVNERGDTHRYVYDPLGRVCQQWFFDGTTESYQYDACGNIIGVIDGEGHLTQIRYDAVGNIIEKIYFDNTIDKFAYDGLRRLTQLENANTQIQWKWNKLGQLVQEIQGSHTLNFAYDATGNRTRLRTSSGREINYEYDSRGRMVALSDNRFGHHRFAYDDADAVVAHTFPNGTTWHQQLDNRQRIIGQSLEYGSGKTLNWTYQYDAADRLTAAMADGSQHLYTYDRRERLISAQRGRLPQEEFRYDACGNVTYSSRVGELSYAAGNLLESAADAKYEHNANGALTATTQNGESSQFEYDPAGRLARVVHVDGSTTAYQYDPLGRRIAKITNASRVEYIWDGFTLLEERVGEASTQYLMDASRLIPLSQSKGDEIRHFAVDRRGCIVAETDIAGQLVQTHQYSSFGALESATENGSQAPPFRLRGQYYDQETGLHYNLHRYYSPETGQFLTRDPLGIEVGRNLYRFGMNSLTWEDPFGLASECQGDVFYRAMSDKELKRVMADCQLKAKQSKCPEGPYVTQNRTYCERAQRKAPNDYKNLVEICTKPGTAEGLTNSPLACRNGSQQQNFPSLPDVVSGNANRIEHKMERDGLNYGLSKGDGLKQFNGQVESMKVVGTNQTCTPG